MSLLAYPLRKNRRQAVATAPVAFNDHRDFIGDYLEPGAFHSTLPPGAPAPFYVHRSRVDHSRLVDKLLTLTYRDVYPALDSVVVRRRVAWGVQRRPGVIQSTPPSSRYSPRVLAAAREFNRVRLDPRTLTCVRRRQRREVLFARRVAGGRGIRSYRRTVHSQWSC